MFLSYAAISVHAGDCVVLISSQPAVCPGIISDQTIGVLTNPCALTPVTSIITSGTLTVPIWDVVRTPDTVVLTPAPSIIATLFTVDAALTDVAVTVTPVPSLMVTLLRAETASTDPDPKPKATPTLARVKAASTEVTSTITWAIVILVIRPLASTPELIPTLIPPPSIVVTLEIVLAATTPVALTVTPVPSTILVPAGEPHPALPQVERPHPVLPTSVVALTPVAKTVIGILPIAVTVPMVDAALTPVTSIISTVACSPHGPEPQLALPHPSRTFDFTVVLPMAVEALTPVTETVFAPSSTVKLPIACVALTPVTETSCAPPRIPTPS